jgi:hypothetical protein
MIPPTRGGTGGVVFRIDLGLLAAGAQREKEEPSIGEHSVHMAAGDRSPQDAVQDARRLLHSVAV